MRRGVIHPETVESAYNYVDKFVLSRAASTPKPASVFVAKEGGEVSDDASSDTFGTEATLSALVKEQVKQHVFAALQNFTGSSGSSGAAKSEPQKEAGVPRRWKRESARSRGALAYIRTGSISRSPGSLYPRPIRLNRMRSRPRSVQKQAPRSS